MTNMHLFGRNGEVSSILADLKDKNNTITLFTGESGIGKSALLDTIFEKLRIENSKPFVGYYSRQESLISESESFVYPFRIVLEKLVLYIIESQNLKEQLDIAIGRIKKGLIKYAKDQGKKIALAVVEDLARKVGLEQTLQIGKEILTNITTENTGILSAQNFISEHKNEIREVYISIFKTLTEEFKGRKFVLIFDQFEYVGKTSTDFFLNMSKFLLQLDGLHIIVAFKTDEKKNIAISIKSIFEQLVDAIKKELNGKIICLPGLSSDDIGEWIKSERGSLLPRIPDLKRIRENSAGLPLLLEEWIRTSIDLKDYDKINRDHLCEYFIKLKVGLSEKNLKNVYRASILLHPIKDDATLANYFGMKDLFELHSFSTELVNSDIFTLSQSRGPSKSYNSIWFRHEIIQKCFESDLGDSLRRQLHKEAAIFFSDMLERNEVQPRSNVNQILGDSDYNQRLRISYSAAYHLHESGSNPEESFQRNQELATTLSSTGDLDLAERSYLRCIKDLRDLQSQNGGVSSKQEYKTHEAWCLNGLALDIYFVWGRFDEAMSNYQTALKYSRELNNRIMESRVLTNIAMIYDRKGEFDKALPLYEHCLKISQDAGDNDMIPKIINNMGILHDNIGNADRALSLYEHCLKMATNAPDYKLIASAMINAAKIYLDRKDYDKALTLYEQSLDIIVQIGGNTAIPVILNNIAIIHRAKKDFARALDLYEQSLKMSEETGNLYMITRTLNNLGNFHLDNHDFDKALSLYERSLEISKKLQDKEVIGYSLNNIAKIHGVKGNYDKAVESVLQAHEILLSLNLPQVEDSKRIISKIKEDIGIEAYHKYEKQSRKLV